MSCNPKVCLVGSQDNKVTERIIKEAKIMEQILESAIKQPS